MKPARNSPNDDESHQPMTLPTTQNKPDLRNKLIPIAFVATAALWLVVIVITDLPPWPLPVYVALGIPVIQRLSRSAKNDQLS
jgi:hypothetical protein